MIFIDKMKNFKIYKTPMFLPTMEDDKKKHHTVLMMTPNYESSKKVMNYSLFMNKLRYASYFLKRDVSYYINSKNVEEVIDESAKKILNDEGEEVPEICPKCGSKVGTYIMGEPIFRCTNDDCKEFFGVLPCHENGSLTPELIPEFYKRLKEELGQDEEEKPVVETASILRYIPESCINTGDKVLFFNEDANDNQLKRLLFANRLRQRKELVLMYDQIKRENPFIKYTFPELEKYAGKNLFVDLYYYNKIFFENNTWVLNKGFNLYLRFMDRLINDPIYKSDGYKKKTIVIPVTDWSKDPVGVWNYRVAINPMSIMYHMMLTGMIDQMTKVFGNTDIIFTCNDKYFKMNMSELNSDNIKKYAVTFKLFLIKMVKNEEFDYEDIDTSADNNQSSEVIKANIIDKIELAKGVDITPVVAKVSKANKMSVNAKPIKKVDKPIVTDKENISKLTQNTNDTDASDKRQEDLEKLSNAIDMASNNANSEEDALDYLDNDEIKQIIINLDSRSEDKPDITSGRAGRISELDKQLMDAEIKGKSIKDILEPKEEKEAPKMNLELSTPNEEWNQLSFVQFDKNYDIDRDIINIFRHFSTTSRPIAIRNMNVENNSTSEDRLELYTVEMEDYRGKRFTVKLDIPIMVDNRFLLRGNNKTIQTQFFNMPIIKTDYDTCQIISNYMKIFVRRFGSGAGKSLPSVSKFIKAANKYTGRKIKFNLGDNSKVCDKYNLPMDYIDLSSVFNTIETDEFIIYFNQDEMRNLYDIKESSENFPYLYCKKTQDISYYTPDKNTFIMKLIEKFAFYNHQDFVDLFVSMSSPRICTYSRCSIMSSQIPLVVICAYHEGLRTTLEKAKINYKIQMNLSRDDRTNPMLDWVRFDDGYLIYECTYESSLLMNGLKSCSTELYKIEDIDNKNMYLEFMDNFGGRIKADGLENFYDLMVDPITRDSLEFYKFPTDYVSILLYANALLANNKFIKHTDTSSRRLRRYILIAVYTYKVLADAYALYSNQLKHSREGAEFTVKQSAVIDKFLTDTITSDDSCINALRDIEATNSITTKGPSGMNSDRAYSLDKRTYDESMLNVLGMSTGFTANVGITRQATIDSNVDENGYIVPIDGDTDKMNTAKSLTATEAMTPFGTTHDDPIRTAMTFIQTAKHNVRTEESDPMLVTNGFDEAMPYITTDKFAYKAKKNGKVEELTEDYVLIAYEDGTKDYINLKETIEKNSDGGYFVPLKLDIVNGLKVGSKITANQIIAYDKYSFSSNVGESDNLAYNVGKLAKIAIINTDEGFEDSGVITESMAEKLATRVDLKYSSTLDKDANLLFSAKVGDHVECGDTLLMWQAPYDDEGANSLLQTLSQDDVSELGKKKLKSEVTGTVKAIKIFRTVELNDLSDSLKKYVSNYEKPLIALEKKLKENNLDTSQVPAHYVLPPTGKLKKAQDAIVVEFYVEYLDTVGIGDKVVYFSANKAVEKNVIPKGKEPYTAFRPNEFVDAFVSETSIDKRMVCSTILFGSLQKLMIELDRTVKDIMGIPYDDSTV